jgi:hypothetical protein
MSGPNVGAASRKLFERRRSYLASIIDGISDGDPCLGPGSGCLTRYETAPDDTQTLMVDSPPPLSIIQLPHGIFDVSIGHPTSSSVPSLEYPDNIQRYF